MRFQHLLFGSVVVASVWPSTTEGQEAATDLRIRLKAIDGAPINGALVALIDAKDSVVAEGVASEAGARVLRALPGVYRVRVRRIGYLPFISSPVPLAASIELTVSVESPRVVLDQIVVNSQSQCRLRDPASRTLAVVWDEIGKALRSSQLTTEDLAGIGSAHTYRVETLPNGVVTSADTNVFRITSGRPFGAISTESLFAHGYVRGNESLGWVYFGPDETVLLSEQFASTHCFKLVRDNSRPRDIGVAFEPAPKRDLPDIEGILWVDQSTSELREIVFNFVNAGMLTRFKAGGFTKFRHVPSGAWIVDEWKLRAPRLVAREVHGYAPRTEYTAIGYLDTGGGIVRPSHER
ncbi:MAG: carboxypeptidase-like regulatory domain-containing protein [Gemmatimonadales bacterium]